MRVKRWPKQKINEKETRNTKRRVNRQNSVKQYQNLLKPSEILRNGQTYRLLWNITWLAEVTIRIKQSFATWTLDGLTSVIELCVSWNATFHDLVSYAATCLSTGTNKYCKHQPQKKSHKSSTWSLQQYLQRTKSNVAVYYAAIPTGSITGLACRLGPSHSCS